VRRIVEVPAATFETHPDMNLQYLSVQLFKRRIATILTLRRVGPMLLCGVWSSSLAVADNGQCSEWLPGPELRIPEGITMSDVSAGFVRAVLDWDHDGIPSTARRLVVAGSFEFAGGVPALNIAVWDGQRWSALGDGLWTDNGTGGLVEDLVVQSGVLIAAGNIEVSGATEVGGIAAWTGTKWEPYAAGVLAPYGVDRIVDWNGTLVMGLDLVGGTDIRAWNGLAWVSLGFVTGAARALHVHQGDLIVGCWVGSTIGGVAVNGVARRNSVAGSWEVLGGGLSGANNHHAAAFATDALNGNLYAIGQFTGAGGVASANVAQWDGRAWSAVGGGLGDASWFASTFRDAVATPAADRRLVVVKPAASMPGALGKVHRFDGTDWHPMAEVDWFAGQVLCVGSYARSSSGDPTIIVGGNIDWIEADGDAKGVVEHDGAEGWLPLRHSTPMRGLAYADSWVYGVGDVVNTGEGPAFTRILRWNGTTVEPLATSGGAEGANGTVRAIHARVLGDGRTEVFVGGSFTMVAGVAASRIARFTIASGAATGTWSAMGSGFNDSVLTIAEHADEIYAGGQFTSSGLLPRARIARWSGSSWQSLGSGLNGDVHAIVSFNGQLHATGEFSGSGIGFNLQRIARWTGSSWQQLANAGLNGVGRALAVDGFTLVVGGTFLSAGGAAGTSAIARWDGTAWSSIGGGFIGNVYALAAADGLLWAGGSSLSFGGGEGTLACFADGSWSSSSAFDQPQSIVRSLRVVQDSLHVAGDFIRIGDGPGSDRPSWAIRSLNNGCCLGDLGGDGGVDGSDLAIVLGSWGPCARCTADLDGDGLVGGSDLAVVLGNWGACEP